jgi:hypothetical protein
MQQSTHHATWAAVNAFNLQFVFELAVQLWKLFKRDVYRHNINVFFKHDYIEGIYRH